MLTTLAGAPGSPLVRPIVELGLEAENAMMQEQQLDHPLTALALAASQSGSPGAAALGLGLALADATV